MTQTPPVSPDFATPPKELVDRAKEFLGHTSPYSLVKAFAVELLAAEERGASRERELARPLLERAVAILQDGRLVDDIRAISLPNPPEQGEQG